MLIGVISDTHGLLRRPALDALRSCDHILHAGDVGGSDDAILRALTQRAPVTAIRGNIDEGTWADRLPGIRSVELGGCRLFLIHNLRELDFDPAKRGVHVVISGHTHKAKVENRNGVLYFNAGSAGPRRFNLPITMGMLRIENGSITPEVITLVE